MTAPALDLAVDALAAYRLTRLVTEDTITEPLRARLHRAAREADWAPGRALAELVDCPWCVGVWAGLLLAAAGGRASRLRRALAVATLVGLVAERAG